MYLAFIISILQLLISAIVIITSQGTKWCIFLKSLTIFINHQSVIYLLYTLLNKAYLIMIIEIP